MRSARAPRLGAAGPRACGPCRRAQRRGRDVHACYGAVLGPDTAESTTWVSCPCRCLVEADGLDDASAHDDTVARVLASAPRPVTVPAEISPLHRTTRGVDTEVDDPGRRSSTG